MCACVHVCVFVFVYVCVSVCIYVCMCVDICVCVYGFIQDPGSDPELSEKSDPDPGSDQKKIIPDPQHCYIAWRSGTVPRRLFFAAQQRIAVT